MEMFKGDNQNPIIAARDSLSMRALASLVLLKD